MSSSRTTRHAPLDYRGHSATIDAMTIYTTTTAAEVLGCHRETVRRIVQRLDIGSRVRGGIVLTDADLEKIRPEIKTVGNPNMVSGNDLWKGGKKPKKKSRKRRQTIAAGGR